MGFLSKANTFMDLAKAVVESLGGIYVWCRRLMKISCPLPTYRFLIGCKIKSCCIIFLLTKSLSQTNNNTSFLFSEDNRRCGIESSSTKVKILLLFFLKVNFNTFF
jgi:hypothetical protein